MRVFRSLRHPGLAAQSALTIGNFDGVHRGHQAMLALLASEAAHRGLPATVLTFEPNPRDYFARRAGNPDAAPARIATLRDKLCELERCGVAQAVVMRFDAAFAAQTPEAFVADVLVAGLGARYVLVGDDFRYGARRAGDYATLDAAGTRHGFDVARMMSYEVHGQRVSSSAVRAALAAGDMIEAAALLGRPYSISGHVVHGKRLGRVLLEVHCLDWPASLGAEGGYGRLVRVELLHKLRDEARYDSLAALAAAIGQDTRDARVFLAAEAAAHAATGRQTTRDRI